LQDIRPKTILFCAILALAIALSVLLRGRRANHWLFAAFAAAVAFWYGSQSLVDFFGAAIWVRARGVMTVLLPQFAVHLFQNVVPSETPTHKSKLTRVATICGAPLLALVLSGYHDKPTSLGIIYTYVFGFLAAALITLARRGRTSPSRAVRDRVRFLVVVGGLATTFTLADFLSFLGVHLPPIGAVLSIVFLFVLSESFTRPRLADMYEMAGRLLVATALAFSLAGIFYLFFVVMKGGFDTMYLNAVLAAIVFLVLFEPLQSEVETRIHQFFFRERFDLETSVGDLRKRLAHVLEIDEMVETVLAGLEKSRRATSVAIYLRDLDGDGFDLQGAIGSVAPKRIESATARPILDPLGKQASLALEELAREAKKSDAAIVTAATTTLGALKSSVLLSVRDDAGELVGILCVADERVRDAFTPEEIALLESVATQMGIAIANSRVYSRMKERDRLAALGSMAAGLAHEVKNPLGAIKGAAQLLEEGEEPRDREFIGIIIEEVNRLDRVVGSFLDYARPHAGNPVPIDINAAVRRTVQILSSQQTEGGVDVQVDLTEALPRARIDPEKFRQVLINLMQNGIQAMDGQGKIIVSTAPRRSRAPQSSPAGVSSDASSRSAASASHAPDEPDFVEVSVRDTGPGISQKVLKNLFVPFFTTKTEGTGLGLAISQSIVQNAGGTIDVQTQPGAGTTFTIVLPAATDSLMTPTPSPASASSSAEERASAARNPTH
jgi:signal transduction histidine kinase